MSTAVTSWNSRKTELELPEEINLQVEVANVGSRTLAILIDLALGGVVVFTIYCLTFLFVGSAAEDWVSKLGANVLEITVLLLIFGLQWVYFNLFEWLWNGQTPGKRLLHLRVIKVDGSPVSGIDILLRNLSRPIDTLGPMGLIGLLMIFVSRKAQRLGDLMAQTLVIHETAINWSIFDQIGNQDGTTGAAPSIRLTAPQWELLHRYLHRRAKFEAEVRLRLAQMIHEKLKNAAKGTDLECSPLPPEEWLQELSRRT